MLAGWLRVLRQLEEIRGVRSRDRRGKGEESETYCRFWMRIKDSMAAVGGWSRGWHAEGGA